MQLICGDCFEQMERIPDASVDLVLTDPPYNIGVTTQVNCLKSKNNWDKINNYIDWSLSWLCECVRVLKPNGSLYFWHNDIPQLAELLFHINVEHLLTFKSFCVWDKGQGYRARTWFKRDGGNKKALRTWFNICEYCCYFVKLDSKRGDQTGLNSILSNPNCFKSIKQWYAAEKQRLGLTEDEISATYTAKTGRKPYMLRHYFKGTQFEIPTNNVWNIVYKPLGFSKEYEDLRKEYEDLRKEYEDLRKEYEDLRYTHHCDTEHCNIWHVPPVPSSGRLHTCQKPLEILQRLIRVSSNYGDTVLDCFMGSGSTGVACIREGREFIGIERERVYFDRAAEWIRTEAGETEVICDYRDAAREASQADSDGT